ncbi:MAG: hypothetical protein OEU80_02825, partial [Deltaproteobacteria bacterium]|nr:hypothetical protein [Deltaproteobacteria bacterium]
FIVVRSLTPQPRRRDFRSAPTSYGECARWSIFNPALARSFPKNILSDTGQRGRLRNNEHLSHPSFHSQPRKCQHEDLVHFQKGHCHKMVRIARCGVAFRWA